MSELTTASGNIVTELKLVPSLFLDKTIVLYGPTKTGKTVIVKNIMETVRDDIDQIIVVAPTEPTNQSYAGFVDPTLIHYRMCLPNPADKNDNDKKQRLKFLQTIWDRQEILASCYVKANNVEVLEGLYNRLKHNDRKESRGYFHQMEKKKEQAMAKVKKLYEEGFREQKLKEVDERFNKMKTLLFKKFLTDHVNTLWNQNLTSAERISLQYLHLNPRLLLIFDDCAAELKPFFNQDIFRKLFYQNRHSFITVIMCCQDGTDLNPNLRKNAFVSIFTTLQTCTGYFQRDKFPKQTLNYVDEVCKKVYDVKHRKLAYIREDDRHKNYYHLIGKLPKPFIFGSDALKELCSKVGSKEIVMDKENPFYEKFRV